MNPKQLRTRQEFHTQNNPKGRDYIVAIDIGYSSTKVFYENGYFVFPSYAKRLYNGMINVNNDKDILYMEEGSDEMYMVGFTAQEMTDAINTNDSDSELSSRKRYKDKRFGIFCNTALALATAGKKDNRRIIVQTGLPSSYVDEDTPELANVLSREVKFKLKVGGSDWREYCIKVDKSDIHIIPQPMGGLYSAIIKSDGKFTDNADTILNDNVIVLDAGFGTFDFYGIVNREIRCKESTDEIGMRQVLGKVNKKIFEDTGVDIRISAMQKYLTKGSFEHLNEDEMISEDKAIAPYLDAANTELFQSAKEKIKSVTNSFRGYRYVIVSGGTGEAWLNDIKEWLSKMNTITILESNRNDKLPLIFSNVRGYYFYRYALNMRR